jgi:hypothetical protein
MFALQSWMSALDNEVEPLVGCMDTNINDVAFIRATTMMGGGCDIIEEFLTCGMYPFSAGFGFMNVTDGTTAMSKVEVPLPVFHRSLSQRREPIAF